MCLMICSKILNYFLISTYDLNQKSNSAPPILSIRCHRVSDVIATATNPSKSVSPIGISVSLRWDCNLSVCLCNVLVKPRWAIGPTKIAMQIFCFPFVTFRSNRNERTGPTEFAWPTPWLVYYQNQSHRVCVIGLTEITLCPNPKHIGPTELHLSPTENPNGH